MLITVQRLDLSTENQRISCIVYYEAEETGLKSEQPSTYTFKISYTNTLFVQELLNYISFTERFTDYSDKDSVLQVLNIVMFCKPFEFSDIAVLLSSNRFFFISAVLSDLKDSLVVLQEYYTSV